MNEKIPDECIFETITLHTLEDYRIIEIGGVDIPVKSYRVEIDSEGNTTLNLCIELKNCISHSLDVSASLAELKRQMHSTTNDVLSNC